MGNLLSVIITNKDHGHFLPRQLDSISSQTVSFDEVILIDDGSSDNSKEVMKNFKNDNPEINVRLFLHDENEGPATRANEGALDSKCKFIYFAASDDYILPDFVSEYKKVINLVGSRVKLIASANFWRGGFFTPEQFASGDFDYIPGYGSAIDRKTLIEFGGYNPKLEFHCDWFCSLAVAFTHGFFSIPRELSVFNDREDSYCHTRYSKNKSLEIRSEMIRVLTEEEAYSSCKDIMVDRCNSHMSGYIKQGSQKEKDSLSIIITNKDDALDLPKQLDSIANQSVLPDELILIDDGSSDNSKEVMKKFKNDHPEINVRLFLHDENKGVTTRINEGVHHSKCNFVFFTGSDDFLHKPFVASHKSAIAFSRHQKLDVKLFVSAPFQRDGYFSPQDVWEHRLVSMPGHCSVVEKDTFVKFGGYNTFLGPETDWFVLMSIGVTYGFYSIPRWLSGVQPTLLRPKERGSYASNHRQTSDNSYMASEMMRVLREEPLYEDCSGWMRLLCVDRFYHSSSWLRIVVDEFLDALHLNISNKLITTQ